MKCIDINYKLSETQEIARKVWQIIQDRGVVVFEGEMGAGKTTLISGICKHLQVEGHVSSPTFALINEYVFREREKEVYIYHMDWYRLKDEQEAVHAGIEDYVMKARPHELYVFAEWPERAAGILPKSYYSVCLHHVDADNRRIEVTRVGE
jgi:tRNA threonylcarbamoyladenosine biosynthesis protein TsaE